MTTFVYAAARRVLYGPDGTPVQLRPQSLDVLDVLLEGVGRVVSRRELLERVWAGLSVTDDSVSQCVSDIRRALGPNHRHVLKTIPKRGYQLVAERDAAGDPLICRATDDVAALAPGRRPARRDDALIGRSQELQLLRDHWHEARAGGGRSVLLSGVAGIGKSRLAASFRDSVDPRTSAIILLHGSPHHTDAALFPVVQHLTLAAGFAVGDTPERRLAKLERLLAEAHVDSPFAPSLIGGLLGLGGVADTLGDVSPSPARERRALLLQMLVRLFVAAGRDRPLLVLVEDAHWIDPSTRELIVRLLDALERERILVIVSARPPFGTELGAHPLVTRLTLNRLSTDQSRVLMEGLAGDVSLSEKTFREISRLSDGVPLFVEEMTRTALQSLADGDGALAVPASLHDSLMRRLERRHPLRHVAQCAACVGRRFSAEEVRAIAGLSDEELRDALDRLVDAELVFRHESTARAEYTFKHALVRDAAHGSLDEADRRRLHAALLELLSNAPDVTVSALAHHAVGAGLDREAVRLLTRAGDEALAQSAYLEALGSYRRALAHLPEPGGSAPPERERLAHRRIEMLLKQSHACMAAHGYAHPSTIDAFAEAERLLDSIEDSAFRFTVLNGNWLVRLMAGDYRAAGAHAAALLDNWGESDDPIRRYMAWRDHALVEQGSGHLDRARDAFDRALECDIPDRESRLIAQFGTDTDLSTRCSLAGNHVYRGHWRSAETLATTLERHARGSAHVSSRCFAFTRLALVHLTARSGECRRLATEALSLAGEFGLTMQQGLLSACRGAALVSEGKAESGLDEMSEGLRTMRASNTGLFRTYLLGFRIEGLARGGAVDEALRLGEETLALIDRFGDRMPTAEIHRLVAEIEHRDLGDTRSAIERLRLALDTARTQGATLWALKSTITLARVLGDIGRRDEAADRLEKALRVFPAEGQSLTDWLEGRALCRELAG